MGTWTDVKDVPFRNTTSEGDSDYELETSVIEIFTRQWDFWFHGYEDLPGQSKLEKIVTRMPSDLIIAAAWIITAFAENEPDQEDHQLFSRSISLIGTACMVCLSFIREQDVAVPTNLPETENVSTKDQTNSDEENCSNAPPVWKPTEITQLCGEEHTEQIVNRDYVKKILEELELLCRNYESKFMKDLLGDKSSPTETKDSGSSEKVSGISEAALEDPGEGETTHPELNTLSSVLTGGRGIENWILKTMKLFNFVEVPQNSVFQGNFVYCRVPEKPVSEIGDYEEMSSRKQSDNTTDSESAKSSAPGTEDYCTSQLKPNGYSGTFTVSSVSDTHNSACEVFGISMDTQNADMGSPGVPLSGQSESDTSHSPSSEEEKDSCDSEVAPTSIVFIDVIEGAVHSISLLEEDTVEPNNSDIPVQPQYSLLVQLLNHGVEVRKTICRMLTKGTKKVDLEAVFLCLFKCLQALKLAADRENNRTKLDKLSKFGSFISDVLKNYNKPPPESTEAKPGSKPRTSTRKRRSGRKAIKRPRQPTDQSTDSDAKGPSCPPKIFHKTAADPSTFTTSESKESTIYSTEVEESDGWPDNMELSSECQTPAHSAGNILEGTDQSVLQSTEESSYPAPESEDAFIKALSPNIESYDADYSDTN